MENRTIRFGNYVQNERRKLKLSKRTMAALLEISDTELRRIESGERTSPNLLTLINMSYAFNKDISDILSDTGYYKKPEEKLFYFIIRSKNVNVFKVNATNEQNALINILDLILLNNLVEFDRNNRIVHFYLTSNKDKYEKALYDFENKKPEELEKIYSTLDNQIDDDSFDEEDDEYDEEDDDEDEEFIFEEFESPEIQKSDFIIAVEVLTNIKNRKESMY